VARIEMIEARIMLVTDVEEKPNAPWKISLGDYFEG
jgi:hypothetical protein